MKKIKVIYSPISGGFWDRHSCKFRGILFATDYSSKDEGELEGDLRICVKGTACEIKKLYIEL